jgi:hypothetical protein
MDAFTAELDWKDQVAYVNNLSKIKERYCSFRQQILGDNYAAIFKRKGEKRFRKYPQITQLKLMLTNNLNL